MNARSPLSWSIVPLSPLESRTAKWTWSELFFGFEFWDGKMSRDFSAAVVIGSKKGIMIILRSYIPIGSMYGIFTYIYHKNQPNVGKYASPMDP